MKLIIYGAGGQGCSLLRLTCELNMLNKKWDEILFADDVTTEKEIMGHRVFPFIEINKLFTFDDVEFVISLGEPRSRLMIFEKVEKAGFNFCEPIDFNKENIKYNSFGKGVIISRNTGLSNNIYIGDNTYISGAVGIGHNSKVGRHSFIGAGTMIGGGCTIGDGTFVGLNASIKDHLKIGSNVIIGMGSCVFNDLPDNTKVIGNPAQVIPSLTEQKVFN